MPSFFIFQYNMDHFIPRRAAAPLGPPQYPAGLAEGTEDVLPLRVGQRNRHRNWHRGQCGRRLHVVEGIGECHAPINHAMRED